MLFNRRLHSHLRSVQARGVRGQDAFSLAATLAEEEVLGGRLSSDLAVRNFHRAEARRRAAHEAAARRTGFAEDVQNGVAGVEERRALVGAIRTARQGLTAREASVVAASLLRAPDRPGPRPVGALVRRVGDLMVQALRNRRDGDTRFLVDARCARIVRAGMRMWLREGGEAEAGRGFRG